jgi:predicted P-loop ATPase
LVLEGDQGTYKSTLLRTLAGDWFTDQIADFGSKDASLQLRGAWIIELSELDALNRSEIARVKAFLTQQTERFRVPYGRRLVSVPRQCIFAGTSNSQTWMKGETAGRRFMPVKCGSINIPAIKRDRDQLWAEAVKCNRAGTPLWLDSASILRDAEEEQRGRLIEDAWQARIEELLQQKDSVTVTEILRQLPLDLAKQDQIAVNRAARCLRLAGWYRYKKRLSPEERAAEGKDSEWRYRRKMAKP